MEKWEKTTFKNAFGDDEEWLLVPLVHYEGLLDYRDEYSAFLTSQGLNLHGKPRLSHKERYGE